MIGKHAEPLAHGPVSNRSSNEPCNNSEPNEIKGKRPDDVVGGRTRKTANTYFLSPLPDKKRSQPYQAEKRTEDTKRGEPVEKYPLLFFFLILVVKYLIQEAVLERIALTV